MSVTNLGTMSYGGASGSSGRVGRIAGDPPGPHAVTLADDGSAQRAYPYDDNGKWDAPVQPPLLPPLQIFDAERSVTGVRLSIINGMIHNLTGFPVRGRGRALIDGPPPS
jgi:hypothetical protein